MSDSEPKGRPILTDDAAESADPNLPAFLARPEGAPVYHGFPVLEDTRTPDGWTFGTITGLEDPNGCDYGDAFVIAPDGTRAGIVWEVGAGEITEILPPDESRWGVYAVWFQNPVRTLEDFNRELAAALPKLRDIHERVILRS